MRPRRCPRLAVASWLLCASGCSSNAIAIVGVFDAGVARTDGQDSAPDFDAGLAAQDARLTTQDAGLPSAQDARLTAREDAGALPDTCLGRVASRLFSHALCTCSDLVVTTGGLRTDTFDSSRGQYAAETALASGADVGANSHLAVTNVFADVIAVGGSLTVASALGPNFLPMLSVRGDLRVGGPFAYTNPVDVGGSLWVAGDLDGSATLHVGGDLRQEEAAARSSSTTLTVDGRDLRQPLSVAPPCPCTANETLNVDTIVTEVKASNDNAANAFRADRLANVVGVEFVELKAGRMFVSSVDVQGNLTLLINHKSALFVEGDFNIAGSLHLEIGPEGSLDLFVRGNLSLTGLQSGGEKSRPAQLRIYMASNQVATLGLPALFAGNLYAPNTEVVTNATLVVYGAIFARNLVATLPLTVHYDSAILQEENDCPPPDQ